MSKIQRGARYPSDEEYWYQRDFSRSRNVLGSDLNGNKVGRSENEVYESKRFYY